MILHACTYSRWYDWFLLCVFRAFVGRFLHECTNLEFEGVLDVNACVLINRAPKENKKSPPKTTCYVSQARKHLLFEWFRWIAPAADDPAPFLNLLSILLEQLKPRLRERLKKKLGWIKYWVPHISIEISSWMLYHIPIPPQSPSN